MWGSDDKGLDVPWRTKSDALEDQIANIDRQLMELDQQEASEQAWLQERRQRLEAIGRQVEPYLHPAKDPTARQAIVDNLDKSMRQSIWYQPRTVQNPPIQIPASELNRDSYTALINQFMSCPQNPRYQRLPNGDTCCDVFVRDVLHATGVDVKEYGSINGIDASLRKANWPAVSAQEAQALANQGVPVVALMVGQGHDQHGAVIVPDSGSFNAEKGARIAQSGANIFMADDGKYVQDGFGTKRMGRVVYLRYPPG